MLPKHQFTKAMESLRWQSGAGLHNPVSTIPWANKHPVRNKHNGSWFDLLGRNKRISGKVAHMCVFTWTYISLALARLRFITFRFYLWKWRRSFANTTPWQKDDHIMYLKGAKAGFESQSRCICPLVVERQFNIAFWWLWEDCHSPNGFTK